MVACDIVKEFLNQLEPEDVPAEYITAATFKDNSGKDVVIKGAELKMLLNNHPDYAYVKDARIFINIQKIVSAINLEMDFLYEMVNLRFLEELQGDQGDENTAL
jgi:hypothetical protein